MKPFFTYLVLFFFASLQARAEDFKTLKPFAVTDIIPNSVTVNQSGFSYMSGIYLSGSRSNKEFIIDPNDVPSDSVYSTSLLFFNDELQGKDPASLLMVKTTATTDADINSSNTVLIVPKINAIGSKTYFTGGFTGVGRLFLIENTFVLPIYGFTIDAYLQKNTCVINWRTETQVETKYFEVERSQDGIHFSAKIQVAGAMTSNIPLNYSWIDETLQPGMNYYRIKEVSITDQVSFSRVATVNRIAESVIKIYPNPVHDFFSIEYLKMNAPVVQLVDMKGNIVKIVSCKGSNGLLKVNATDLPDGMYLINIFCEGKKLQSEKLIKY